MLSRGSYTLTITPASGAPLVMPGITDTESTLAGEEALTEAAGPYTWRVEAVDDGGDSAASSTRSFFVDQTPPAAFSSTLPEPTEWTRSSQADLNWEDPFEAGSGVARYVIYVDGEACGERLGEEFPAFRLDWGTCDPGGRHPPLGG